MKTVVAGFLCALVLVSGSGCSGNYSKAEDATKEMLGLLNDISATLESVKDRESARAAAPKLESLVDRTQEVQNRALAIKGTKADQERLEKAYKAKVEEAKNRLKNAVMSAVAKAGAEPSFTAALQKATTLK